MTLLRLGAMLRDRRGGSGIREVAQEIGISPATHHTCRGSGRLPDIATFQKICSWLKINPAEILDISTDEQPEFLSTLRSPPFICGPIKACLRLRLPIWRN